MVYRSKEELTIVLLQENEKDIHIDRLKEIILKKPSSIIYCEYNDKLYGVLTMIDINRACDVSEKYVSINTNFIFINSHEYTKVQKIFAERKNIHSVPVLDENGILKGDWSRWNSLWIDYRKFKACQQSVNVQINSKIAFVYHDNDIYKNKRRIFEAYYNKLISCGMNVMKITCDQVSKCADVIEWVLTIDEDESEALSTLYCSILDKRVIGKKIQSINNLNILITEKLVEQYLQKIYENSVYVLNLKFEEDEYSKKLQENINKKFAAIGEKVSNKIKPVMYQDFFDDLGDETYIKDIMKLKFPVVCRNGQVILKDYNSPLYNVIGGERLTVSQPEKYLRTVYFIGPCFIYGHYVEDSNTIESILQQKINSAGYNIKVVNYGSPIYSYHIEFVLARIMETQIKKGDIIIVYLLGKECAGIKELNLNKILMEHDININWIIDHPVHCNHKINNLYADAIYKMLNPIFNQTVEGQGELIEQNRNFIKIVYLDRYFADFVPSAYREIGAIVMNCNPFTYGHRYLIEQALKIVDFLIIFVVEEDRSAFSFAERFVMVCDGVADLENVMVVPSGPFILSQTTFPEYFIKAKDVDLMRNMENDITIFAEKIAPYLNISYRFVGEEPEDEVTNQYNLVMKYILPKKGIRLIEISRKKQDGKCISASKARENFANNNISELRKLLPESTIKILTENNYMQ